MINRVYLAAMRNGPLILFSLALFNTVASVLWGRANMISIVAGANSGLIPFIIALVLYRFDLWQARVA